MNCSIYNSRENSGHSSTGFLPDFVSLLDVTIAKIPKDSPCGFVVIEALQEAVLLDLQNCLIVHRI